MPQLIPQLAKKFPENFNNYFEPFVGSSAVFFYLKKIRPGIQATLLDSNEELMNCYQAVRDRLDSLIPLLEIQKINTLKNTTIKSEPERWQNYLMWKGLLVSYV